MQQNAETLRKRNKFAKAVLIKNSDLPYAMLAVIHTSEFIPISKLACVFIVTCSTNYRTTTGYVLQSKSGRANKQGPSLKRDMSPKLLDREDIISFVPPTFCDKK